MPCRTVNPETTLAPRIIRALARPLPLKKGRFTARILDECRHMMAHHDIEVVALEIVLRFRLSSSQRHGFMRRLSLYLDRAGEFGEADRYAFLYCVAFEAWRIEQSGGQTRGGIAELMPIATQVVSAAISRWIAELPRATGM